MCHMSVYEERAVLRPHWQWEGLHAPGCSGTGGTEGWAPCETESSISPRNQKHPTLAWLLRPSFARFQDPLCWVSTHFPHPFYMVSFKNFLTTSLFNALLKCAGHLHRQNHLWIWLWLRFAHKQGFSLHGKLLIWIPISFLGDGIHIYRLSFFPLLDYVRLERDYLRLKKNVSAVHDDHRARLESSRTMNPIPLSDHDYDWMVLTNKSSQQRTSST